MKKEDTIMFMAIIIIIVKVVQVFRPFPKAMVTSIWGTLKSSI